MRVSDKNTLREITKTKSRFLSILLICAIGVGFFSGVRAAGGDMRVSADDYYDENNLFDLRVLSTFGLTDGDLEAIEEIDGVDGAYASKYTDLARHCEENEVITRVYSKTPDEINTIDIYKGRAPEADDEVIVNCYSLHDKMGIGDKVTLEDLTNADEFPLKYKEYTIVGMYNTPMFISMTQRGSTTIGDGVIDALMIVPEDHFTQEPYTEIYVRSDRLKNVRSYSDEYEELREEITDRLTELGAERSEIRFNEVLGDAQKQIEDGEAELEKSKIEGQKELEDAKKQLEDAKKQIEDGEKELENAKKQIDEGKPQMEDAEKKLAEAKAQLDAAKAELDKNKAPLDEAKAKIDAAKKELEDGEKKLAEGKAELDKAEAELTAGEQELSEKKTEVQQARALLDTSKSAVELWKGLNESNKEDYERAVSAYNNATEQLAAAEKDLQGAIDKYGEGSPLVTLQRIAVQTAKSAVAAAESTMTGLKEQVERSEAMIVSAEKELADNEKLISDGEKQIAEAEKLLQDGRAKYESGLAEYEKNKKLLQDGRTEYESGLEQYLDGLTKYNEGYEKYLEGESEYNNGYTEFAISKAKYDAGVEQYEEGTKALEDAKAQYKQGLIDYEDGKHEFETKISDAEKELSDAKEKIASAGNAQWYIFTRDDNQGYAEYNSNAERIDRIAAIFPVFFLLVAGLVCLTTMSRMVEEQRTQIGTLKALGYSRGAIMRHYMTYAVTAALIGGALGAVGGSFLFPGVIVFAYSMMYQIVDIHFMFTFGNLFLSIGSMTLTIALTVFFSCNKALKETPASLMRPKAPKAGKRIFIEKIPFIWNKMNFFAKVSARNLLRYKRRMCMTIVGIAGCTALSLTGFGLKNSITDIANLQYNDIYRYSGYAAYKDDIKLSELESIYTTLTDYNEDTDYTRALIRQYDLENSGNTAQCYITAVEDEELFETFVDMRDRTSKEKVSMKDGAVITEKAAKLLGAKTGDEITIKISDGVSKKVTISGITEQYVGHYLYLDEEMYRDIFGQTPKYNMIYFFNDISRDDDVQAEFTEHLLNNKNIQAVIMNAASLTSIYDTLKIMDLVVLVLIISAAALAFVVLYNLTNVNITERIREIATLKVLGFYDGEVSSYVFRESIILSLIGALIGLGLGFALCMFVITTAELDEVMFGRSIHGISYLWAFLVTAAFSMIVNLIMTRVLKKVSMVESLKSVE